MSERGDQLRKLADQTRAMGHGVRDFNIQFAREQAAATYEVAAAICDQTNERQALADLAEIQATFDLQCTRMDKATKIWQQMTGRHDTLPDLGNLLDWLLQFAPQPRG